MFADGKIWSGANGFSKVVLSGCHSDIQHTGRSNHGFKWKWGSSGVRVHPFCPPVHMRPFHSPALWLDRLLRAKCSPLRSAKQRRVGFSLRWRKRAENGSNEKNVQSWSFFHPVLSGSWKLARQQLPTYLQTGFGAAIIHSTFSLRPSSFLWQSPPVCVWGAGARTPRHHSKRQQTARAGVQSPLCWRQWRRSEHLW